MRFVVVSENTEHPWNVMSKKMFKDFDYSRNFNCIKNIFVLLEVGISPAFRCGKWKYSKYSAFPITVISTH